MATILSEHMGEKLNGNISLGWYGKQGLNGLDGGAIKVKFHLWLYCECAKGTEKRKTQNAEMQKCKMQ